MVLLVPYHFIQTRSRLPSQHSFLLPTAKRRVYFKCYSHFVNSRIVLVTQLTSVCTLKTKTNHQPTIQNPYPFVFLETSLLKQALKCGRWCYGLQAANLLLFLLPMCSAYCASADFVLYGFAFKFTNTILVAKTGVSAGLQWHCFHIQLRRFRIQFLQTAVRLHLTLKST